ncbi:MAG: hypothetical protein KDB11_32290 [Planctomycetales bacterium]|nr:hypothetical protein [Planctomycetales bacterium]
MRRHGVSLLEVLFSIGVISIGLLGVIALYPLALGQIGTGVVADRSARAGQNAVQVFSASGMARPDQLLWFPNSTSPMAVDASVAEPILLPEGRNSGYLIDPMFVAVQRHTNGGGFDARLFPYYTRQSIPNPITPGSPYPSPYDPRLRRITLRNSNAASTIMTAAQAELLFRSDDDLTFELPLDRNAPPDQIFGANNARRQYEGTISWMATLVPQLDITNPSEPFVDANGDGKWNTGESYTDSNSNSQFDSGTGPGELYQLSIIVFDRRDSTMAMNDLNEKIANVASFHNLGLGGGDVTLGADTLEQLEVKPGQWLMLMSTPHPKVPTSSAPGVSLFSWYRVIDMEDEPRSGSSVYAWERDVVLQGPDWPVSYFASLTSPGPAQRPTRAVLVSNVVAVYERTIRLEISDSW